MIFNPIVSQVIDKQSWSSAYVMLGVLILAVNIPVSIFLLKNARRYGPSALWRRPDGGGCRKAAEAVSNQPGAGAAYPLLLAVCSGLLYVRSVRLGDFAAYNSYMTDLGYSTAYAALVVSVAMGVATAGKVLMGMVFDRYGGRTGISVVSTFLFLSCVFLIFFPFPMSRFFSPCVMALPTPSCPSPRPI